MIVDRWALQRTFVVVDDDDDVDDGADLGVKQSIKVGFLLLCHRQSSNPKRMFRLLWVAYSGFLCVGCCLASRDRRTDYVLPMLNEDQSRRGKKKASIVCYHSLEIVKGQRKQTTYSTIANKDPFMKFCWLKMVPKESIANL